MKPINSSDISVISMLIMLSYTNCHSDESPTLQKIALYQPNDVLVSRIGEDASDLSKYILEVQKISIESARHHSDREFAVIVAWTNDKTVIYIDALEKEIKDDIEIAIPKIKSIMPPKVKGPVMFAIVLAYSGAKKINGIPHADEWDKSFTPNDHVPKVLPDSLFNYEEKSVQVTDEKFSLGPVTLVMHKPDGWIATSFNANGSSVFRIIKEKNADGSFYTGTTLNIVSDVKNKTNVQPGVYAKDYLEKISKNDGVKILDIFAPVKIKSGFTRSGIRVEEMQIHNNVTKLYVINYSAFADDAHDIILISIYGTPKDEWDNNYKFFEATLDFGFVLNEVKPP